MGGWVLGVVLAVFFCGGAALGACLIGWLLFHTERQMRTEMDRVRAIARADVERERQRADNAVDGLSKALRGEPISLAAVEETAQRLEADLRAREDLQEMWADETEEPEVATDEG